MLFTGIYLVTGIYLAVIVMFVAPLPLVLLLKIARWKGMIFGGKGITTATVGTIGIVGGTAGNRMPRQEIRQVTARHAPIHRLFLNLFGRADLNLSQRIA